MIKTFINGLLDLVYPPHCLTCQKYIHSDSPIKEVCPSCIRRLLINHPPFCLKCSRHLSAPIKHSLCPSCQNIEISFDFAWCAYKYDENLKNLIHQYKYDQKTQLVRLFDFLIETFIDTYGFDISQFDYIIPIPLFPARLRERGFNQAELLAKSISINRNIQLSTNNLVRIKNTHPQASLHQKERWTNISGAFRIKHPCSLKDKNILIFDDLLTTGSTVCEAARMIKASQAKTVGVLTLAVA